MARLSRTVAGLDLGQHTAKVVLARANGDRLQVLKTLTLPFPSDVPDPGRILRNWWEEQELGHVPVAIAVNGSRILYQHLHLEEGDPRTPDQIATLEAARFGDMTDASMVHSATPASPEPGERRLMIALVRPDLLQQSLQASQDAGLKLVYACPAPVALYNGVTAIGEPIFQPTLIADLGANHTEVVIGTGRGVVFARSFAMGVSQLTQAVASQGKLPPGQAERARLAAKQFGELPGEAGRICEQFVLRWTQEIKACLQMYADSPGTPRENAKVQRVLLCGGGSLWPPLREALKEKLPVPVQQVGLISGHEDIPSAAFLSAAGLAADALGIARAPSSLLPESIRALLTRERNKRYWGLTGVFSVLAMGMVTAATHISVQREQAVLTRHNDTLQRCERIAREISQTVEQLETLERMKRPLVQFVSNSSRIRDLTLFLAEHKGPQDFLTFLGDSESYLDLRVLAEWNTEDLTAPERQALLGRRRAIESRAQGLRDRSMDRIIVEGYTPRQDLSTVKALIEALRNHPAVDRADLLPDDFVFADPVRQSMWDSTRTRRFVLDLRLHPSVEPLPEPEPESAAPRTRRPR